MLAGPLAELGVGTAIAYRLYKTLYDNDAEKTGALIKFYRKIYYIIALVVLVIGLSILPFLKYFIGDYSSLPADINVYLLYLIFLVQSVASYLFSYKTVLFTSDQKNYVISFTTVINTVVVYSLQLAVLYLTENYLYTLITSVVVNVVSNIVVSIYAQHKYKEVFASKMRLDKLEKKEIYKETGALLCHRIGGTVVTSTDNILISSFIGVAILGAYSNYALIITALVALLSQFISAIGASVGNLHVADRGREEEIYLNLQFFNLFVVGICAVCFFVLVEPFITVAFGESLTLGVSVALVASANFYLSNGRLINNLFISNCGLFMKDKFRPLIEALVNLVASIVLVQFLGIVGILAGTIIGVLSTVWWREPYLLYKYEFKKSQKEYWKMQALFFIVSILTGVASFFVCSLLPNVWWGVVLKFAICISLSFVLFFVATCWTKQSRYFVGIIKKFSNNIREKLSTNGNGNNEQGL